MLWIAQGQSWILLANDAASVTSPLSPQEAQRVFRLDPQLTIELVACEPQVIDPVAISFGDRGELWVAEMSDYPHGPAAGEPPRSRLVKLTDSDGDGCYETREVFADGLLFCTGVLPYRDGVLVTVAGELLWLAYRPGQTHANHRETWFQGFAQENSQLRANHPTYGPDGWIYVANGLRGGKVQAVKSGWPDRHTVLNLQGNDFAFHPESGAFRLAVGHSQFGLCFDRAGRRYVCSNRHPCQVVMLEHRHLAGQPHFAPTSVVHDVCAPGEQSRLFPLSSAWTTSTLHAHQFTAACGVLIWAGEDWPSGFQHNAFTCDPTGNLVHREVLSWHGCTLTGTSPYRQQEFLASPDTWFRPVNLAHGPDGSLYVVDMYRAVIEHPDFMPSELKQRPDLWWGNDRGRIWRIRPRTATSRPAALVPTTHDPHAMVAHLQHPYVWHRELALRKLVENGPWSEGVSAVRSLLQQPFPCNVTAMNLLGQWQQLTSEDTQRALETWSTVDELEVALRWSESWISTHAGLQRCVEHLLRHAHPRVRYQALLALTQSDHSFAESPELLYTLRRVGDDTWLRTALLLALKRDAGKLLACALEEDSREGTLTVSGETAAALLALAVRQNNSARLLPALQHWQERWSAQRLNSEQLWSLHQFHWGLLQGWGQAAGKTTATTAEQKTLAKLLQDLSQTALTAALDQQLTLPIRLSAIKTLRWLPISHTRPLLRKIVNTETQTELLIAACEVLATQSGTELVDELLARFPQHVPAVRRAILDVLLSDPQRSELLLAALEQRRLQPAELDPPRAQRLQRHRDPAVQRRARDLFAAEQAARQTVIDSYAAAAKHLGDPWRGKALFQKHCSQCHRIADVGVQVGPDIGDTRDKTPLYLLTAILDPNRVVDSNYFGYAVVTRDGRLLSGLLTAETPTSITLRQPEGKTETLLRSEIEELRATGQSLMPVGLEQNISVAEMADLISFLKNWRYMEGNVPGVLPGSDTRR
ncbi:MAG: hypothetical protein KatS3mg113_0144 [Planctomycetaceae bacterium]|nr:MAG: hypothetical protein KatS3mg113_0144 [Planctomycetaceae bacterium]